MNQEEEQKVYPHWEAIDYIDFILHDPVSGVHMHTPKHRIKEVGELLEKWHLSALKAAEHRGYERGVKEMAEELQKLVLTLGNPESHHPPRCLMIEDIQQTLSRLTEHGGEVSKEKDRADELMLHFESRAYLAIERLYGLNVASGVFNILYDCYQGFKVGTRLSQGHAKPQSNNQTEE